MFTLDNFHSAVIDVNMKVLNLKKNETIFVFYCLVVVLPEGFDGTLREHDEINNIADISKKICRC